MNIKIVDFETVRSVWLKSLWHGRTDVKPMSSMVFNNFGVYDMTIYTEYKPTFWAVYNDNRVIAVNSGFRTEKDLYRSRGIWVDHNYRGQGISEQLFQALENQAVLEGCTSMWSYPKKEALSAYERFGFVPCSEWISSNKYGTNCYVLKDIQ
jgi:GNAT superfamily N-acetyltransferase